MFTGYATAAVQEKWRILLQVAASDRLGYTDCGRMKNDFSQSSSPTPRQAAADSMSSILISEGNSPVAFFE
jgi:hypothetical protein